MNLMKPSENGTVNSWASRDKSSGNAKSHQTKSGVTLSCTVGYKWVTLMGGVKFEFNDIII